MSNGMSRSLSDLLAAAEKRKLDAIRARLGLSPELRIEGVQLEALAYHLLERCGPAHVKLESETLRVGETPEAPGIQYRGDAIDFLLKSWGLTREQARAGATLTLKDGRPAK